MKWVTVILTALVVAATGNAGVLRPPVALYDPPAGKDVVPFDAPLAEATVDGAARTSHELGMDGLRLPAGEGPSMVRIPLGVAAADYNTLVLRMRIDRGDICGYKFVGPATPDAETMPWNHGQLRPGLETHTYAFHLESGTTYGWRGHVEELVLVPTPAPANALIEGVTLIRRPEEGPRRVTLDRATRLAIAAEDPSWTVELPEQGRLVAFVGAMAMDGKEMPVRYSLRIRQDDHEEHPLAEGSVPADGRWHRVEADLSDFAGALATLQFAIDAGGSPAWWASPRIEAPAAAGPPVILIANDTLRADHLGCYGYRRNTTPSLDAFAEEAVLFENAVSEEPITLPAHMTMLTGLHPLRHGVTPAEATALDEAVVTLPEALAAAGYVTGGFTGHGPLLYPERGFAQGFDVYSTPQTFRDILATRERVDDWLDTVDHRSFFLFFHNYDIHSKFPDITLLPYFPVREEYLEFAKGFDPPPLPREGRPDLYASGLLMSINAGRAEPPTDAERDYMIALYDDSIRAVDDILGTFFAELKARGIYDRALIIVTADHGESFGEHGLYAHDTLFEPCAHVPLLVRFPGGRMAGTRVEHVVQLADLMPTVLQVVNAKGPGGLDGESLLALAKEDGAAASPAAGAVHIIRNHWQAMRGTRWKLVHDARMNTYALFNVAEDPLESIDRSDEAPEGVLQSLRPVLDEAMTMGRRPAQLPAPGPMLTEEERDHLRALGYAD